ncbi:MAG: hypothetical protein A2798_00040 [Candidatus Levybacteria bacterium RIFCSPHIGHO2_01_FULL_37_17]|nr:MAG: hypothetical protein A2798_00040 [Candidatus Levybacteria bacterium RIFCSPHIGHO2_01_FULL_37_17]OGH36515.1 MAG: hypothetical protein A2959_03325 [Candidatus Levybacteria bacterium RIFCSPLOWO2_01_FULL_38_23]
MINLTSQNYFRVAGIIFGLVAAFHLLRVLFNWSVSIGPYEIPMWASYFGFVIAAVLSYFGCKHGKFI